jgi:hypothetical protein
MLTRQVAALFAMKQGAHSFFSGSDGIGGEQKA